MKGAEKNLFGKKLFLSPMRGSRAGTLLSSEVQFQDIVIEIVHTNAIQPHTNRELGDSIHGVVYYAH